MFVQIMQCLINEVTTIVDLVQVHTLLLVEIEINIVIKRKQWSNKQEKKQSGITRYEWIKGLCTTTI